MLGPSFTNNCKRSESYKVLRPQPRQSDCDERTPSGVLTHSGCESSTHTDKGSIAYLVKGQHNRPIGRGVTLPLQPRGQSWALNLKAFPDSFWREFQNSLMRFEAR